MIVPIHIHKIKRFIIRDLVLVGAVRLQRGSAAFAVSLIQRVVPLLKREPLLQFDFLQIRFATGTVGAGIGKILRVVVLLSVLTHVLLEIVVLFHVVVVVIQIPHEDLVLTGRGLRLLGRGNDLDFLFRDLPLEGNVGFLLRFDPGFFRIFGGIFGGILDRLWQDRYLRFCLLCQDRRQGRQKQGEQQGKQPLYALHNIFSPLA